MHEGGTMDKLALQKMAVEVRKGIVSSVHSAKAGHPGGSLSAADIFTYLYFEGSEEGGPRPFCAVQGTHGAGTLLGTGKPRLFSGGGSFDPAPYRIVFTGTS